MIRSTINLNQTMMAIMMNPKIQLRLFSSSLSSPSSFSRRTLSPLIKCIHPDMFAQELPLIQQTNLSCLMALNEMCDSIDSLKLQAGSNMIEISKPLLKSYTLDCYLKIQSKSLETETQGSQEQTDDTDNTSHPSTPVAIQVILKTPLALCSRQRLSHLSIQKALRNLFLQLGPLYLQARIHFLYINLKTSFYNSSR
jgi:hypothetical protein